MEITNISDAEFKTLVIRILKELIEYGSNIKGEMKVTLSEIKKNLQGTNSGGEEARIQINNLEHKEVFNQNSKKKTIQKKEDSIRNLWDISKCTTIRIIEVSEG